MTEFLFDVPECKSPKLLWIEQHGIKVQESAHRTRDPLYRWYAYAFRRDEFNAAYGSTEEEALAHLAVALGIRLWNEEVCHD
jgi:hypothetical protein